MVNTPPPVSEVHSSDKNEAGGLYRHSKAPTTTCKWWEAGRGLGTRPGDMASLTFSLSLSTSHSKPCCWALQGEHQTSEMKSNDLSRKKRDAQKVFL